MIITKQMFESFNGWCSSCDEGNLIAPLPQEYDIEYQLLIDAGREDLASMLALRKPQLIKATNNFTLGNYRVYDEYDQLYKSESTLELIETKIDEIREKFYQANKNRISSVWINELPNGAVIWENEDFENLVPNKKHRIYDFTTGENVLFNTTEEARTFVDLQIQKLKDSMIKPKIQQLITYNGGGLSGWITL